MARMQRISIASLACVTALQSSGIVWPCRRDGFEGFEYENGEKEEDNYKFMHVLLVLPLLLSVHPLLISGSFYSDYAFHFGMHLKYLVNSLDVDVAVRR